MRKIPFSPPDITEAEINEVVDTLRSGWITTGPKTKKLECEIAKYCNTSKAVCLNSATASMEMTLRLLGIGPGDEVITCAYTYTASASVIQHVGAKIVLVDSKEGSYHIDYDGIFNAITPKTKAIIPVDIAGVMCDYEKIIDILELRKNLFKASNELQKAIGRIVVIADGAHSFGSEYKGKKSGEVADFTAFSFHAVKNLTTAEGGAITWRDIDGVDNEVIYKQYKNLSQHGQTKDALAKIQLGTWEYDIVAPYYKCNMTDIMASLGLAQLERYNDILFRRREMIRKYTELLNNVEVDLDIIEHYGGDIQSNGHLLLVRIKGINTSQRNDLIIKMAEKGVATNVHFKPLPLHTAYKDLGFDISYYPNALKMYENEITLPLYTLLSNEDIDYVVDSFEKSIREVLM